MRLKIASKKSQLVVTIDDDSTMEQLLLKLSQSGIIQYREGIKIKASFPPKSLDMFNDNKLADLGVQSGDKLIIEESSPSSISQDLQSFNKETQATIQNIELTPKAIPKGSKTIPFKAGSVNLHEIPDNNSCLFDSIKYSTSTSINLREIAAENILADPINYNDAILGKPVDDYIRWIMKDTSWGGAIELQILSMFLGVTINSIDVETGRVDSFNPDAAKYIVVLYTGIHYDAVVYKENGRETRVFDKGDDFIEGAKQLAENLNYKGYVTNVSTFKVKCKTCGQMVDGEKGVADHATKSEHFDFGEV